MATLTLPNKPSFLTRKIALGITPAHILVVSIMLLSLTLHLSNLDAIGDANTYYTAAVESMTQSWHNFFFAVAERHQTFPTFGLFLHVRPATQRPPLLSRADTLSYPSMSFTSLI